MDSQFPIIGWREWVSLPELGIDAIKAKIDTGARTSCLHAFRLEAFQRDNQTWLKIWVHPIQNDNTEHVCEAKVLEQRSVTDSGGHQETRYVIETILQFGEHKYRAEFTLTNRDTMKFRMLIGRQALNGRFLVNPQASYLQGSDNGEQL